MLGNFKGKPEKDGGLMVAASVPKPAMTAVPASAPAAAEPEPVSTIAADMSIIGNVVCRGRAEVFGRVEGELHAADLMIGEGAEVSGNVVAQELTVSGRVKGTIRAVRVRLTASAVVEGDIFHRSLSIEEQAMFEGSSRRVENPTGTTPVVQPATNGQQAQPVPVPVQALVQPDLGSLDAGMTRM